MVIRKTGGITEEERLKASERLNKKAAFSKSDGKKPKKLEVGSGVYFYQMRVEGYVSMKRMVLVK